MHFYGFVDTNNTRKNTTLYFFEKKGQRRNGTALSLSSVQRARLWGVAVVPCVYCMILVLRCVRQKGLSQKTKNKRSKTFALRHVISDGHYDYEPQRCFAGEINEITTDKHTKKHPLTPAQEKLKYDERVRPPQHRFFRMLLVFGLCCSFARRSSPTVFAASLNFARLFFPVIEVGFELTTL